MKDLVYMRRIIDICSIFGLLYLILFINTNKYIELIILIIIVFCEVNSHIIIINAFKHIKDEEELIDMKTVQIDVMGEKRLYTKNDIKMLWDPTQTFTEATKYDDDRDYIYSYTNTRQLYVKVNGAKIPIPERLEDFED